MSHLAVQLSIQAGKLHARRLSRQAGRRPFPLRVGPRAAPAPGIREWREASQAYDEVVRLSAELGGRAEAGDPAALERLCAAARHAGDALDRHRTVVGDPGRRG